MVLKQLLFFPLWCVPLTVFGQTHSVLLNWNWAEGSGSPATGFHIKRGNTSGGPYSQVGAVTSPTILTFTDNGPFVEGNTYYYVVSSVGPGGESPNSAEVSATIPVTSSGTAALVGYWSFDEGTGTIAADSSGGGHNGAVNGASWIAGEKNSALSFNGSTSDVATSPIALSNTFSVSAWVNPSGAQTAYARIAETQYNDGLYLGVNASGTQYKWIVNNAAGATAACGRALGCAEGGVVTAGWHLVTGTYDGATGRLYVDGTLVATETFTAPPNTNLPLYIGRYSAANGYGWHGGIDEVRLYSGALTGAQVAQLYGSGGGLIGYWSFDEGKGTTAADSSGGGHNGTVNGASWIAGETNSALSFNGSTSDVATSPIALANTFSVSAWVNPSGGQTSYARIAETQYNAGLYLGVNASGTQYKWIVNNAAGGTGGCGRALGCAEGGVVTAGWHLVTGTYDGATGRLYVDGTLVASETFTAPPNTNFPLYIGRYYGANGYGWKGGIDEVRLYSRAITGAEVAQLYGGGGGLIGYWPFDEGRGSTAADASGGGHNGTVNGAGWIAGVQNSALSFNGSTNDVATSPIAFTNTFTVSAWVNPFGGQTAYARIAETQYNDGLYLGVNAAGTQYKWIVNNATGASGTCGRALGCAEGGAVAAGWHLVTGTYDGTTGRLYVDGILVASETFAAPPNASFPLFIGRFSSANGYGWNGGIDEVRLYNRALTAAEIQVLLVNR